jgi:hypothetical protein
MTNQNKDDAAQKRLQAVLKGAFAGPPTPLKAIPKKAAGKKTGASKASPRRNATS